MRPDLNKRPEHFCFALLPWQVCLRKLRNVAMSVSKTGNISGARGEWEIGMVAVIVLEDTRNALCDTAIALVRCSHMFPPVRPCRGEDGRHTPSVRYKRC